MQFVVFGPPIRSLSRTTNTAVKLLASAELARMDPTTQVATRFFSFQVLPCSPTSDSIVAAVLPDLEPGETLVALGMRDSRVDLVAPDLEPGETLVALGMRDSRVPASHRHDPLRVCSD